MSQDRDPHLPGRTEDGGSEPATAGETDRAAGEVGELAAVDATFRVAGVARWVHAVTLAILAAMAAGMLSTGTLNWVVALFLALVALQALNTVVLWRWRVHTDESEVTIQRGIGQPRTLGWASITAVRRGLPPRIEVADGPDVSLGAGISRRLLTRAAAHIHAHAARRR